MIQLLPISIVEQAGEAYPSPSQRSMLFLRFLHKLKHNGPVVEVFSVGCALRPVVRLLHIRKLDPAASSHGVVFARPVGGRKFGVKIQWPAIESANGEENLIIEVK